MRVLLIVGGLVAALVLFFVLRAEDDTTFDLAQPRTTHAATNGAATTAAASPPVTPRRVGLDARVLVRGGRPVDGIQNFRVQKGGRVRITVRADVVDHVHVHGYDLVGDVRPGSPARFAFTAKLTGRFEIELEERGVQIAELEVRP